jgi:hypothetical protein
MRARLWLVLVRHGVGGAHGMSRLRGAGFLLLEPKRTKGLEPSTPGLGSSRELSRPCPPVLDLAWSGRLARSRQASGYPSLLT